MASPVYQAVSGNSGTSTSFTATEPTGTASGDGLLMFVFSDTNPSGFTGPSGWNLEANQTVTDGTNTFQARIYSIRRGGSAPSLGASWTGSTYFEWTVVRISGIVGSGAFVEELTSSTPGSGSVCDSPSATPTSANTLALSCGWSWSGFTGSQAQPTGYTLIRQVLNTGNTQAYKALSTTTAEDPSAWGSGTTAALWANTIIIASQAATGPTITGQPSAQQVASGSTASFSVTASATGGGSLTYQWKLNGTNVSTGSGGTTSSYTTAAVALSDSGGLYTCDVTETGGTSDGTTTSSAATLLVGVILVDSSTAVYTATGTPTTIAPTWPTTAILSGSVGKVLLVIGMKPATSGAGSVTTPAGWNAEGSIQAAGGYTAGGASAADTGNCDLYVYSIDDPGTVTGTQSVTVNVGSSTGVAWAKLFRYSAPSGTAFSIAMATGSDTSAGSVSITFGSDPGVTAGDRILGAMCIPTDVTTPSQFSAEAFGQTGVTFGTVTELQEPDSANNNDIGGFVVDALATAGTSSAAPVMTATAGGTTTNVRGPGVFVRLRAASSGTTGTGSAAESSFAASGSGSETFTGTGSAAESPFAASATGTEKFTGTGSAAASPFAASASGSVANFNGNASAALSPFAAAAVGVLAFVASGSVALSSFAASGSGAETFSGTCTASSSPFGATSIATETFTGTAAAARVAFACSATGAETFTGTCSAAFSPFATSSSGTETFTGTGSAAVSPFACSATGTTGTVFSGSATCALSPFAASASGAETFTGSASAAAQTFAVTCSGTEKFTATGSAACSPFASAATGTAGNVISGSASCALSQFAASASGLESFSGSATSATSPFATSCTATEKFTGTSAAACSPFASTAAGTTGSVITGAASCAVSQFAISATGDESFSGSAFAACQSFATIASGSTATQPAGGWNFMSLCVRWPRGGTTPPIEITLPSNRPSVGGWAKNCGPAASDWTKNCVSPVSDWAKNSGPSVGRWKKT